MLMEKGDGMNDICDTCRKLKRRTIQILKDQFEVEYLCEEGFELGFIMRKVVKCDGYELKQVVQ